MVWERKDMPSGGRRQQPMAVPPTLTPTLDPDPCVLTSLPTFCTGRAGGTATVICRLWTTAFLVKLFLIYSVMDESEPYSSQSLILRTPARAGVYIPSAMPTITRWMPINSYITDGDLHGWLGCTLSERSTAGMKPGSL